MSPASHGFPLSVYDDVQIDRLSRLVLHTWDADADRPFWIRIRQPR